MYNLVAIINLIIAVQAFFLSLHFLLKKKGIKTLNLLMSALTFIFSITVFNTYYELSDFSRSEFLQDIANNLMWFIGPSIFIYSTFRKNKNIDQTLRIHYLPYLVPFIFDLFTDIPVYNKVIPVIAFIQMITYLVFSFIHVAKNYDEQKSYYSWINPFLIFFSSLVLLNVIFKILVAAELLNISNYIIQSFTTLLIFPIFFISYKEMNAVSELGISKEKYSTTKISDEKLDEYFSRIEKVLIEEKLFCKPAVTISDLSQITGIPSKYISQTINIKKEITFTDYLLNLRIDEVKNKLRNPEFSHYSIAGIASECGFSSISYFNNRFKKITGLTPGQFRTT